MTGKKETAVGTAARTDETYTGNKDTNNILQIVTSEVERTSNEGNDLPDNVFIPDWNNKPPDIPPIVSIQGVGILTAYNTLGIIAAPGFGKSSVCEVFAVAFLVTFLKVEADTLGITVGEACKGVIYIDCERTHRDVWNSFNRIAKRIRLRYGQEMPNVIIAGLRNVAKPEDRRKIIEKLCQGKDGWLLIIDGAGDLVRDTNDNLEAVDSRIWVRDIIAKNNLTVITTLHPTPNSLKPRGHQGGELTRECESVAAIINNSEGVRLLTTDFQYGKNRNNSHATTAFAWSDDEMMFVSADVDEALLAKSKKGEAKQRARSERLVKEILPAPKALSRTALQEAIMEAEGIKIGAAKTQTTKMVEFKLIKKHEDGLYRQII